MSNPAIILENISKRYRLGMVGSGTLREDIVGWWYKARGKEDPYLQIAETNNRAQRGESNYVWALQDINFSLNEGEVLGVIGKNGAGKSTLLKLLSRVTAPTTGSIKARGRIASLLEVGTGFHPELSGRDNIFLNGAIMGMRRAEIKAKFDEIVDFAGVERYIDTPVKRYSSGMYVRLAFAVAAHLEPEILIVDEVLAVGDAQFQKKAIGKMKDVSKGQGRTVLFVSHNMASIENLCNSCALMHQGKIEMLGKTPEVVSRYLSLNTSDGNIPLSKAPREEGSGQLVFSACEILNAKKQSTHTILCGERFQIKGVIQVVQRTVAPSLHISLAISNKDGLRLMHLSTDEGLSDNVAISQKNQQVRFCCDIPGLNLPRGEYYITLFVSDGRTVFDHVVRGVKINIEDGDFFGNGKVKPSNLGLVLQKSTWSVETSEN